MERTQFKSDQRIVQSSHATAVEKVTEQIPAMFLVRPKLTPIEKHVVLVRPQLQRVALRDDLRCALEMFEAGSDIAESKEEIAIIGQAKGTPQRLLAQVTCRLVRIAGRLVDGAIRGGKGIVVDNQRPMVAAPVGVGEHILIHRSVGPVEIEQQEVLAFRK